MENDRIEVVWPECGEQPAFARDNRTLAEATRALHGTETPDPLWAWTNDQSLITVHPLGGCVMADDAAGGVVDHKGRVFDPVSGGVHDGLYVCDGSVIPCALDANPSLTISAIAERTAALLIEDRKWAAGDAGDAQEPAPELAPGLARLQFTERLTGFVSMSVPDDYTAGLRPRPRRQRPGGSAHHDRVRRHPGGAQRSRPGGADHRNGGRARPVRPPPDRGRGHLRALRSRPGAGGDLAHAVPDDAPGAGGASVLVRGPQGDPRGRGPACLVRDDDAVHDDHRAGRAAAGDRDPLPEARRPAQADPQHQGRRGTAATAGRVPPGVPRAVRRRDGARLRRRPRRGRGVPERAENGAPGPRARRPGRDLVVRRPPAVARRRQARRRRLPAADQVPGRRQGAADHGDRVRHVIALVPRVNHRAEPDRVPGRPGLRHLAVRLPGGHRPAVVPDRVHDRRRRPGGLAGRGQKGPRGDRPGRPAGVRALRGVGLAADGDPGRAAGDPHRGLRAVPHCTPPPRSSTR